MVARKVAPANEAVTLTEEVSPRSASQETARHQAMVEEELRQIRTAQADQESITETVPETDVTPAKPQAVAENQTRPSRPVRPAKPPEVAVNPVRPGSIRSVAEKPIVAPASPVLSVVEIIKPPEPHSYNTVVPVMEGHEDETVILAAEELSVIEPAVGASDESWIELEHAETDDVLAINRDDLSKDFPELAALYDEPAGESDPVDYIGELPLDWELEPSLLENVTAATDGSEAIDETKVLFGAPEEQLDLAALLQSLEPEQAEAAQPVLSVITRIVREIQGLPTEAEATGDDVADETEKLVLEQALEQWCYRLMECLNIDADAETIRHFAGLMASHESAEIADEEPVSAATLNDKGMHEYKPADGLAALGRLAHDIKQKLHLPLWLGRYTLRIAAA